MRKGVIPGGLYGYCIFRGSKERENAVGLVMAPSLHTAKVIGKEIAQSGHGGEVTVVRVDRIDKELREELYTREPLKVVHDRIEPTPESEEELVRFIAMVSLEPSVFEEMDRLCGKRSRSDLVAKALKEYIDRNYPVC